MDTQKNCREIGKWIICVFTCCVLIFLGIRHISSVASAVGFLADLFSPLLIGIVLALIFNVPMRMFERLLRRKTKLKKGIRPLSIVLALVLVFGIFIAAAFLVVPELFNAIKLIVQIIGGGLDSLDALEMNSSLMESPLGTYLAGINIDWTGLKTQLEEFFTVNRTELMDRAVSGIGSIAGWVVKLVIGFVFAIYILAQKETLKRQVCWLVRTWLPKKLGDALIHVCGVCSQNFQQFIGGQATEAIILGTLCMLGMVILRIPYAAMVGALVGVTALIPIVGAYVSGAVGTLMILTVNPVKALVFLIYIILLQQVENNLIYPKVVGSKINLPAIWVLAAVTIGGTLGGPIGMLLGVPAASSAYALLREATVSREAHQKRRRETSAPQEQGK